MQRRTLLGSFALAIAACTPPKPPPLPPPPPEPAKQAPPPPPVAPYIVVRDAEPSARRPADAPRPNVAELDAEGKKHALTRIAEGVLVMSEERGVLGFISAPASIRWAGFVDNDAMLVFAGSDLYRASSPDDAVVGKLERIDVAPASLTGVTMLASGGKVAVIASPLADGAFYVSRDSGHHWKANPRPDKRALADLAVRSDGMIVAAIETETFKENDRKGVRTDVYTSRAGGAWTKGPIAEAVFVTHTITQTGDAILVSSPKKPGDPSSRVGLGLDAKGKWIEADYPGSWLSFSWTNLELAPSTPVARPGFPKPRGKDDGLGVLGGIMGALGGGDKCEGADCLGYRWPASAPPYARAFHDGVCTPDSIRTRNEKIFVPDQNQKGMHEDSYVVKECDPQKPIKRASSLLVLNAASPRVAHVPTTCGHGHIAGTDRATFVHCSSEYAGKAALYFLAKTGELSPAGDAPGDLEISGAESANDGTTVLYTRQGPWICALAPKPSCAPMATRNFLAARPLPGGRALIARRGISTDEVLVELANDARGFGTESASSSLPSGPIALGLDKENLLEIEITNGGYIRLWLSPTLTWFGAAESLARKRGDAPIHAVLARADGRLVPDAEAKDVWVASLHTSASE